jgi:hypothetical protein
MLMDGLVVCWLGVVLDWCLGSGDGWQWQIIHDLGDAASRNIGLGVCGDTAWRDWLTEEL